MNPIVMVGTASTPSVLLETVAEVVDPVACGEPVELNGSLPFRGRFMERR